MYNRLLIDRLLLVKSLRRPPCTTHALTNHWAPVGKEGHTRFFKKKKLHNTRFVFSQVVIRKCRKRRFAFGFLWLRERPAD